MRPGSGRPVFYLAERKYPPSEQFFLPRGTCRATSTGRICCFADRKPFFQGFAMFAVFCTLQQTRPMPVTKLAGLPGSLVNLKGLVSQRNVCVGTRRTGRALFSDKPFGRPAFPSSRHICCNSSDIVKISTRRTRGKANNSLADQTF